jgi:hypothetical protein
MEFELDIRLLLVVALKDVDFARSARETTGAVNVWWLRHAVTTLRTGLRDVIIRRGECGTSERATCGSRLIRRDDDAVIVLARRLVRIDA